jgi:hypothetical protein
MEPSLPETELPLIAKTRQELAKYRRENVPTLGKYRFN